MTVCARPPSRAANPLWRDRQAELAKLRRDLGADPAAADQDHPVGNGSGVTDGVGVLDRSRLLPAAQRPSTTDQETGSGSGRGRSVT
jgi:hypothetical protein